MKCMNSVCRFRLPLIAGVLFVPILAAAALAPDELGEEIAYTLDLDPLELVLKQPSAADLERVAAAIGAEPADLLGLVASHGRVDSDAGEKSVGLVRVPFDIGDEQFAALLVLDDHGDYVAGTVVNEFGEPEPEWGNLFGSLQHYRTPRLKGAHPRSHLAVVRARAEEGSDDPEARLTLALLTVLGHMNEQAAPFNIPREMQERSQGENARMMSEQYAAVLALTDDLSPLLGSAAEDFARLARDSSERAAALADAYEAGDSAAGQKANRRMMSNCRACHGLILEQHDGRPISQVFGDERDKRGIGDGYWQVGHDVRIHHADRKKLQRVADALRTGALLIDATR